MAVHENGFCNFSLHRLDIKNLTTTKTIKHDDDNDQTAMATKTTTLKYYNNN